MSLRLSLRQLPDESLGSPNGRRELGGAGFWRMYGSIFFRCSSFSREEGGTTCKTNAFSSSKCTGCSSSRVQGASRGRRECTCTRAGRKPSRGYAGQRTRHMPRELCVPASSNGCFAGVLFCDGFLQHSYDGTSFWMAFITHSWLSCWSSSFLMPSRCWTTHVPRCKQTSGATTHFFKGRRRYSTIALDGGTESNCAKCAFDRDVHCWGAKGRRGMPACL